MPSFRDSLIFIFCKGLQGREIYMPPRWLILVCRSLRTFVQERMEKIPVWRESLHFQWVIWQGGEVHLFSFLVEMRDLPRLYLCPVFWNHLDPANVERMEFGNSCQAVCAILGKAEVEGNSWISSSSLKKKKHIYIYSFLFYFALVTSVSPSSCSHKLLSVNTSLGHDKSWHSGAKLSETMWQKEKIKKKSWLRVNEAGRPNMWNVYIHPNWEADALVLGWTREWAKSFCFGEV